MTLSFDLAGERKKLFNWKILKNRNRKTVWDF
jgi:hypothetical protein